mgnify:CR=1 FL=1
MGLTGPGLVPGLLGIGAAPARLNLGSPLLGGEATQLGRARRLRRTPRDGRNKRCAQDFGEALAGGRAIAALGTILRGGDGQDTSGQAFPKLTQGTLTLLLAQGACRTQVQAELHPRICGIHSLSAGARSVRKALDQLPRGHDETTRAARPSGNTQIIHAP